MKRSRRRAPAAGRGTLRLGAVLAALVLVNLYVFLWRGGTSIPDVMEQAAVAGEGGGPLPAVGDSAEHDIPEPGDRSEPPGPGDERGGEPDEPGRWVEGSVQSGDSLGAILQREGLTAPEANQLIRALAEHMDMRSIKVGQPYRMHFDDAGRLTEFEFHLSRTLKVRAVRGASGELTAEKIQAETRLEEVEIGGTIEGSLYMTMKRAGEDTSLVPFFVDVFAYDLNFYIDTHPGDTYRIIVEKEYLNGEFLRYGRVLAAEYSGKAGTYRAFWWQPPGASEGKYFDEKGRSVERTFLKTPLKYARISSRFNPRRMHPILHVRRGHYGVDYAAPSGTPVWAAAAGKIVFRGRRGGAGNCVIVKHDNGYQTTYMHLSKFRKGQKVGQRVRPKDVIGYVGMTGLATGPHLHFSVKANGRYVDPLKMKMSRGAGVAKKDRAAFEQHIGGWVTRLAAVPVTSEPAATLASDEPAAEEPAASGSGPGPEPETAP
ncbi:MAG TPA: peptidoglycan DD-metalloendopeptidase family protein [Kofleriaceae bacterium]|nr:peptidoglycan DD-metalloendopeptidase family protein [Kofleriaceae bacterium]